MTDHIEALVVSASAHQLSRLVGMVAAEPRSTDEVVPELADIAEMISLLGETTEGGAVDATAIVSALLNPATLLLELREIFVRARQIIARAPDLRHRAVAELIYHATIAAAATRHGVNLGRRSLAARQMLFARLAEHLADNPIGELFRSAARTATDRNAP